MAKLKRGQKMVCIACAREVIISNTGVSRTTLWCCGKPMQQKAKAAAKKKTPKKIMKKSK